MEWIWVGQQRKRSVPRFSKAADQEEEGSRDWASKPGCTAFYTPTGVIIAAHRTEVRVDLATLPEESGRGERHAVVYPLHLRNLRWVSVTVTGDLDEVRIGGFEWPHATLCQIYRMLESAAKDSCSDCPTLTPDRRSFSSHRMAQGSGCARDSSAGTHGIGRCSGCPR